MWQIQTCILELLKKLKAKKKELEEAEKDLGKKSPSSKGSEYTFTAKGHVEIFTFLNPLILLPADHWA